MSSNNSLAANSNKTPSQKKKKSRSSTSTSQKRESSSSDQQHLSLDQQFQRTPLYCYIVKKDWNAAKKRCISTPTEASTWIITKSAANNKTLRFLPLHKACVLQPPTSFIESLISAYPDGVLCTDHDGWLPIHCGAYVGAHQDVMESLLLAHPAGAMSKDKKGLLPLHYACMKGASREVLLPLLQYYPEAIKVYDGNKRWPVHYCILKNHVSSLDVILSTFSDLCRVKEVENNGKTLLHYASNVENASEDMIRLILGYNKSALKVQDKDGNTPLHYVCLLGSKADNLDLVKSFVDDFPDALSVRNNLAHTPIDCVQTIPSLANKEALLNFFNSYKKNTSAKVGLLNEENINLDEESSATFLKKTSKVVPPSFNPNNSYFVTQSKEVKSQLVTLQSSVDSLSKIFQEISSLKHDVQVTITKAKEERVVLMKLKDQLNEIRDIQERKDESRIDEDIVGMARGAVIGNQRE